jgi:hypothetical protein
MNAMLLKMARTRKRRTSSAMNVRSTIVEARYPARSVIVVMPRTFLQLLLLASSAITRDS